MLVKSGEIISSSSKDLRLVLPGAHREPKNVRSLSSGPHTLPTSVCLVYLVPCVLSVVFSPEACYFSILSRFLLCVKHIKREQEEGYSRIGPEPRDLSWCVLQRGRRSLEGMLAGRIFSSVTHLSRDRRGPHRSLGPPCQ